MVETLVEVELRAELRAQLTPELGRSAVAKFLTKALWLNAGAELATLSGPANVAARVCKVDA